ncbi:hypothetical protein FYJ43_04350 [Cutibacterium sp. WCA-380-WT-3A]|uniref:Minor tail protein n=1 Tax=Cutibacterium porci TaxID=2605781 RepID=A0A7K0J698_9ACTN|nr:hypothetical protein [Cutibacterium porci]MSS45288.1 hypothetical protein [Cutibacterium porci]
MSTIITAVWGDTPPHMAITAKNLPSGTAYIRVSRIIGSSEAPVRGAENVIIAGNQGLVTDWDAPLDTNVTYRVLSLNANGGHLENMVASFHTGTIDCDTCWVSNPLDPASALHVDLMAGTDDDTSHDQTVTLSSPGWSTNLPSAIVGVRQLGGKRTLIIRLTGLDTAQQFEDLLRRSITILVRAPAIRHRTGLLYMTAQSVSEHRERDYADNPAHTETTWTITGDEVDPGTLPVIVSPWTYQNLADYARAQSVTTYDGLPSLWTTYLDAQRGIF